MISEDTLDNVLVAQKNELLQAINRDEFQDTYTVLFSLRSLWFHTNYGYKGLEVIDRATKALQMRLEGCAHRDQLQSWQELLDKFRGLAKAPWINYEPMSHKEYAKVALDLFEN